MSKLDKDTVVENFTQAYTTANGKAPTIEAKGGWYSVNGGKNVRLAQLEEMTAELSVTKSKPKAAAKTAEPAKKVAPKPKKAAKKKASTKGFSVKDFYTQQIQSVNPGAKAPR